LPVRIYNLNAQQLTTFFLRLTLIPPAGLKQGYLNMNKAEFDSFANWAYQYKVANGEHGLHKLRGLLKPSVVHPHF